MPWIKQHYRLLLILAFSFAAGSLAWVKGQPPTPSPPPAIEQAENEGGPALHPLMIEAIRAREYPGGEIKLEQQLSSTRAIISYPSDGLKIYGLLSLPGGKPPADGWPVVILNHGYIPPASYRTDGPEYSGWTASLTRAGFAVIKPDYRGHGRSEGSPASGHFAPDYAYDTLNLVASLKRWPQADPRRIGMFGHSLGGHVTLRSIVVSPDIKASVTAAGVVGGIDDLFYNWRRFDNRTVPTHVITSTQKLVEEYGEPKTNPDFWNRVSAVNYVDAVAGPVQIHHGTADRSVPILMSERLNQALLGASKPVEFHTYPGGDHNFSNYNQLFVSRVIDFFRLNL